MSRRAPVVRFREPPTGTAVRAVALVLHGGKVHSHRAPHRWQSAVARMRPFAAHLSRAGGVHGLAVGTVLYRQRGWNSPDCSPMADVRTVLGQVNDRFGPVPVVLVGHSLGGRTALRCAGAPAVLGVVALAPWLADDEPVDQLRGRQVLIVHGEQDRWTDPAASLRYAGQIQGVAATAGRIGVANDGHSMLRRAGLWHQLATAFTLRALDLDHGQSGRAAQAYVVERARAGHVRLVV